MELKIFANCVILLLFSSLIAWAAPDIHEDDDTYERAGIIVLNDVRRLNLLSSALLKHRVLLRR